MGRSEVEREDHLGRIRSWRSAKEPLMGNYCFKASSHSSSVSGAFSYRGIVGEHVMS